MNRQKINARRGAPIGFTLIELMVAISVMGVLIMIAAPSLREAMMNVRMTGHANDLMADLQLARSEAVKRNLGVFLCASTNQSTCNGTAWHQGWLVFADTDGDGIKDTAELPLKVRAALEGSNTLQSAGHLIKGSGVLYLPYRPTGISLPGVTTNFVLCDSRTAAGAGRRIQINVTGRAQSTRETCPATP